VLNHIFFIFCFISFTIPIYAAQNPNTSYSATDKSIEELQRQNAKKTIQNLSIYYPILWPKQTTFEEQATLWIEKNKKFNVLLKKLKKKAKEKSPKHPNIYDAQEQLIAKTAIDIGDELTTHAKIIMQILSILRVSTNLYNKLKNGYYAHLPTMKNLKKITSKHTRQHGGNFTDPYFLTNTEKPRNEKVFFKFLRVSSNVYDILKNGFSTNQPIIEKPKKRTSKHIRQHGRNFSNLSLVTATEKVEEQKTQRKRSEKNSHPLSK